MKTLVFLPSGMEWVVILGILVLFIVIPMFCIWLIIKWIKKK